MTERNIEVWIADKAGTRLARLAPSVVSSITYAMFGKDSAQITYKPNCVPALQLVQGATEIHIWINEELRYIGVPYRRSGDHKNIVQPLDSTASYLEERWILSNKVYNNSSQELIASSLLTYAQNSEQGTNPDLNMLWGNSSPSGVNRTLGYFADQPKNILDILREFPEYANGFDWNVEFTQDGRKVIQPYYPRKGVVIQRALEFGREFAEYTWEEDLTNLTTKCRMTGGTYRPTPESEPIKLMEDYEDVAASELMGVRVQVVMGGNEVDAAGLESQAQQVVTVRKAPIIITSVTCGNDQVNIYDTDQPITVGDWIKVRIDHGVIQVSNYWRIIQIDWNESKTKLTFAQAGGLEAGDIVEQESP